MTEPLKVSSRTEGKVHVLSVKGEVDMESSPHFLAELQQSLRPGADVAVDLADVNYIDSSGIAVLVQGLKGALKRGARFRLRNPSKRVLAVLRLAQLLDMFQVDDPGAKG